MERGGEGGGRAEAVRLLGIAEQLLDARDLARSRSFCERAIEADPLLDGADRVMAAADVLLAAQRSRINNHVDWYAVLQLDASPAGRPAPPAVRLQYRRLALLLRPDPRRGDGAAGATGGGGGGFQSFFLSSPSAAAAAAASASSSSAAVDEAFKLVSEAWGVLSDPAKRELLDKEIDLATAAHQGADGGGIGDGSSKKSQAEAEADADAVGAFWTACSSCCYVHQYARGYEGRALLCHNCRKAFQATEMASPPPVVPGKDMYFCAWGLFPLGFPGGPNFVPGSAPGLQLGHGASGEPWRQSSLFQGFPWGPQGPSPVDRTDGWVDVESRGAAKRQTRRSSAAKRGKANGTVGSENDLFSSTSGMPFSFDMPPKKPRKKVMAKRQKKQVASADVDAGNKEIAEPRKGVEAEADAKNPQKAGCPRTIGVSAEDLNLNFAIDVNAAAAIIESMGMSTLTFSKDEDVVVVDQLW